LAENEQPISFKVGYPTNNEKSLLVINSRQVVEAAGGEFQAELCDMSPISIITAMKNLIDDGCAGIVLMPTDESILPQVSELCEEGKIFWSISMRPVFDPRIRKILDDSEYFVGSVMENDETVAYDLMKLLWEHGKKKVVLVSSAKSDPVIVARERGIYRAAEEYGMEIVAGIYNAPNREEVYSAMSDLLVAKPEIDAVFNVGGHFTPLDMIVQAVEEAGRDDEIKLVSIDLDKNIGEYLDKDIVLAMAGGHHRIDTSLSAAMVANAVIEPLTVKGRDKLSYVVPYMLFSSSEELSLFNKFYDDRDGLLFTTDAVKRSLLNGFGDESGPPDFNAIIGEYTIENITRISRGGGAEKSVFD